jgi:hypothetical protein
MRRSADNASAGPPPSARSLRSLHSSGFVRRAADDAGSGPALPREVDEVDTLPRPCADRPPTRLPARSSLAKLTKFTLFRVRAQVGRKWRCQVRTVPNSPHPRPGDAATLYLFPPIRSELAMTKRAVQQSSCQACRAKSPPAGPSERRFRIHLSRLCPLTTVFL